MALAKTTTEVDAWAKILQAALRIGAEFDVSDAYDAVLHVDIAIGEAVAHTGTEIIVQVGTDTGNANDKWSTLTRLIGPTGTPSKADFAAQEVAGQTVLSITNPIASNLDNVKKFWFIVAATEANCEIVYAVSQEGDTTDTVTIHAGLTNQQETTSDLLDIDDIVNECVGQLQIAIPSSADRIRVLYNNNYDADGAISYSRARITKLTGI